MSLSLFAQSDSRIDWFYGEMFRRTDVLMIDTRQIDTELLGNMLFCMDPWVACRGVRPRDGRCAGAIDVF